MSCALLKSRNWVLFGALWFNPGLSVVWAAGYKVNEQSASGVGNAYAGRVALVEDASVVFYNPAGMAFLEQARLSGGLSYLTVDGRVENARATNKFGHQQTMDGKNFNDGGNFVPNPAIPFLYFTAPLNDQFAAGLGFFVPFGASSKYKEGFVGAHFADQTKVQALEVQPALAYRFSEQLSFGLGLDLLQVNGQLTKALDTVPYKPGSLSYGPVVSDPASAGYESRSEIVGKDWGYGFNLSFMWQPLDNTTLGAVYRSAIDLQLKGHTTVEMPGGSTHLGFPNAAFLVRHGMVPTARKLQEDSVVDIVTPQMLTLGVTHQLNQWLLQAGLTWTQWSKFQSFDVRSRQVDGMISRLSQKASGLDKGYISYIPAKWRDVINIALGASYRLNDTWLFRTGYAFDQSPIPKKFVTSRFPATHRHWLAAGFNYRFTHKIDVDFGAAYLIMDKVQLDEYQYNNKDEKLLLPGADPNQRTGENLKADYEINAFGLSAQFNWKF